MIRLLAGDCRDVLPSLRADSVQCVVTSPPYYALRSYLDAAHIGIELSPDYTELAMERCRADAPLFAGDMMPVAEDPADTRMADLFAEAAE